MLEFLFTKKYKTKLLTYFLPAPNHSVKGYRERQLDHIINSILEQGFQIEQLHTESLTSSQTAGGMWIIFQLRPLSAFADRIDINRLMDEIEESLSQPTHEHIEGLYSIE
jgi:hypothetical protein